MNGRAVVGGRVGMSAAVTASSSSVQGDAEHLALGHDRTLIGYFTAVSLTLRAYDVPSDAVGLKR